MNHFCFTRTVCNISGRYKITNIVSMKCNREIGSHIVTGSASRLFLNTDARSRLHDFKLRFICFIAITISYAVKLNVVLDIKITFSLIRVLVYDIRLCFNLTLEHEFVHFQQGNRI